MSPTIPESESRPEELPPTSSAGDQASERVGRPPVCTNQQLIVHALALHEALGRAPTAPELIEKCGGCQKQRALQAIQQALQQRASQQVLEQINLPPRIQQAGRAFISECMAEFAQQYSSAQQLASAQREEQQARIDSLGAEREAMMQEWGQQRAARDLRDAQREQQLIECENRIALLEQDGARWAVLAEERERVITQLSKQLAKTQRAPKRPSASERRASRGGGRNDHSPRRTS